MNIQSKRITDLNPTSKPGTDSFFVIANLDNTNNKISFKNLKESLKDDTPLNVYNTMPLSELNKIESPNDTALGVYIGSKIYQETQRKIPINNSNRIDVNTPLNFTNTITSKKPSGSNSNEVVNVGYLNNILTPYYFNEFKTREFIYGNEILTTIGKPLEFDKTDPNNWSVVGSLGLSKRTNETGWQKLNTKDGLRLKNGKKISDYKKIIFMVADEDGNTSSDIDTQILPFEYDCSKYIYYFQEYKKRKDIFDGQDNVSTKNPVTIRVCNQDITWTKKIRTKNNDDIVYISENEFQVVNNSVSHNVRLLLKYTPNYDTEIYGKDSYFLVSVIGLK